MAFGQRDPWAPDHRRSSPRLVGSRAAARRLRDALDRAGYNEAGVQGILGKAAPPPFRQRRAMSLALRGTQPAGPLETLVRLFLLREGASVAAARRALGPRGPEDAIAAGLLEAAPAGVRATVELTPFEGLAIAADWPGGGDAGALEVMGIASSSRALADLTLRREIGRALDLGTGSGVLALLAATHSRRVTATDRNPRAIEFARFNAQFNGVGNVAFRAGDLFEPVRGETFDLIVCNPPFVLAPAVEYVHTHSGKPADDFCREIVRTAPAHLSEGGLCQIVCNWAIVGQESWRDRLAGWLAGSGCDAWVLVSHTEDAAAYARDRIAETSEAPARSAQMLDEWMASYARERIEAVGFGVITMRRREGPGQVFSCEQITDIARAGRTAQEKTHALRAFLEAAIGGTTSNAPGPTGSRS